MRRKFWPLVFFLGLSCVYLIYWKHAEYVLDDWGHFLFYQQADGRGFGEHLRVLRLLFENKPYGGFQLFWVSLWMNCFLVWVFGYAPQIAFGAMVLLHAVNSWLFYLLLCRLRVDPRIAFLAGACLVLIPTAHGPLFWPLNCSFYVWPLFWLLLYLLWAWRRLESGIAGGWDPISLTVLVFLVLFSGSPAFFLLVWGPLWLALCLGGPRSWKRAVVITMMSWLVIGLAMAMYPPFWKQVAGKNEARHLYSSELFWNNLEFLWYRLKNLTGLLATAYYKLSRSPEGLAAGGAIAAAVLLAARKFRGESKAASTVRLTLFAAGMCILSYVPLAVLNSQTLRHYYTFSPYLVLLLIAPAAVLAKSGRAGIQMAGVGWGAVLCGYFAACTVAEIQQCWIPQSRETRMLKGHIASLENLAPGDWVVMPGVTLGSGTAPPFALGWPPWDGNLTEVVTGVERVSFARELVIERGQLRFYHLRFMKDVSPDDIRRVHIVAPDANREYRRRRYVAWERARGRFQILPLKGSAAPRFGAALVTRDQLGGLEREVYFPKPFEHGNIDHLHY